MTKLEALNKIITEKLSGTKEGNTILEAVNLAVKAYNGTGNATTIADALEDLYTVFEKGGGGGGGDSHITLDFSRPLSFTLEDSYKYPSITMLSYAKGKVDFNGLDMANTILFPALLGCKDVTEINLKGIKNTENVINYGYAFMGTSITSIDITPLTINANALLDGMFAMNEKLETLDLSSITGRASSGGGADGLSLNMLVGGCTALKTLDISNLDLAEIPQLSNVFTGCTSLTTIKWKTGENWITNGYDSTIDFSYSPLDRDTIIAFFTNLGRPASDTATKTIVLNPTTAGYLSEADRKIAEDKGWTITP